MTENENQHGQMPDLSLEGITLQVTNVERSLEFYQQIPGARVLLHRPGSFALLAIGKGRLSLLKVGPTHLEFDVADVDGLYHQLKEVGWPVEAPPNLKSWGEYDFVVHDPDGHCLEFNAPHRELYPN